MKKLIILVSMVVLASCTKNKESIMPNTNVQLQSITYGSGAIKEQYQNGKCVYDIFGTYTYDGPNGMLSKSVDPDPSYFITYNYNTDNTISSSDHHQPNNVVDRYIYTYTNNNINLKIYTLPDLSTIRYQVDCPLQNGLIVNNNGATLSYDSRGNVISYISSGLVMTNTFDDKPSVVALKLKGMFGDQYKISAVLTHQFDGEQLENNFLTNSKVFSSSSYYDSYTYVYGSNGYPTKSTDNNGYILNYNYN